MITFFLRELTKVQKTNEPVFKASFEFRLTGLYSSILPNGQLSWEIFLNGDINIQVLMSSLVLRPQIRPSNYRAYFIRLEDIPLT